MKITLREAYHRIGLRPLGEFAEENKTFVGATTWMLVEAAIAVVDDRSVVIVGHNLLLADRFATTCQGYIFKLMPGASSRRPLSRGPGARVYEINSGGKLFWESDQTLPRWLRGRKNIEVFRDLDYRVMAMHRQAGPFAEIRKLVRQPDGTYAAYDARGEFLLDLPESGAKHVADAEPYRVVVED